MIFISHNSKDKPVVEPIAEELAKIFGEDKVFYDSWSIQPGDSLVGKMNAGLAECQYFLLFVSDNSLNSEMVKLEWRNALLKATNGNLKFIPIRMDKVQMPAILTDTLFIDAANCSQSDIIRQITDVVQGRNTYRSDKIGTGFHNLVAYIKKSGAGFEIEFQAQQYMEPISRYLILVKNEDEEIKCSCPGESMFESGFQKKVKLNSGTELNAWLVAVDRPTTPGFPLFALLEKNKTAEVNILGVMKADTRSSFVGIPLIQKSS